MLAVINSHSPAGSSLAFDYAAISEHAMKENGAQELRSLLRSQHANEPTRFGIRLGEIDSFLASQGFVVAEHQTAAEMTEKYLPVDLQAGTGKIPSLFCLVHAKKK
jgi:O-methyltransferase involved in polyketide biosynthesis